MMNLAIILLALQAETSPSQITQLTIKDRGQSVEVSFSMPREPRKAIMQVFRQNLVQFGTRETGTENYGQILQDAWERNPQGLPEEGKNLWKVDVLLRNPGLHEIIVGKERIRVRVSRSDFKTWRKDLDTLQEMAARVQTIAERMDEAHKQHQWKVIQKLIDEDIKRERAKVDILNSSFSASPRAVKLTMDRMRYHVMEIKLLPGANTPTAQAAMRGLKEYIDQEAVVRLVDELIIGLGHKEKDEQLVNRWSSREAVLQAVTEACMDTAPGLVLEPHLKAAIEKSEEDPTIVQLLKALRHKLVPGTTP